MTQDSENALEASLAVAWPPSNWRDSHVLLAVSGGPDSVAMLRAVMAQKRRVPGRGGVCVGHFNHRRRPEAGNDLVWLESVCRQHDVPFVAGTSDVAALATLQRDGWEAAARSARYDFLRRTAEKLGARFVAVAHTADDQVETVLHRLIRGTGMSGLAGMPFVRPLSSSVTLVRPLLQIRRREVIEYLRSIGQDFCFDATNTDLQYTRNRLRHELLPALRKYFNADVDEALLRIALQAGESQQVISSLAADLVERYTHIEIRNDIDSVGSLVAARVQVDCRPLADYSPLLLREVCKIAWTRANWPLQAMGFEEWQELAERMLSKECLSPINLPGNIFARREVNFLILEASG